MYQNSIKDEKILPGISVVVIGLNVEKFLQNSLQSIFNSNYPTANLEVIYVDSGSTDLSLEIARSFKQVKVIELYTKSPSAAMARNSGFRVAQHDIIQFVDADSYLHPDWLKTAVVYLKGKVAAVSGELNERFPEKNWYHQMAHLEWNLHLGKTGWTTTNGIAKTFGGNVLLLKSAMKESGGYDEDLSAGEDPDLSYRIRQTGWQILRINQNMASHDINLQQLKFYLKRNKRSGYAYLRVAMKHRQHPERNMIQPILRIISGVLSPAIILISALFSGYLFTGVMLALCIIFRLLLKVPGLSKILGIKKSLAVLYSLHLAFAIYPQFLGILHGIWDLFSKRVKYLFTHFFSSFQLHQKIKTKELL